MKQLQVTWKGVSPLIMHSCKCVNPLHPLTKAMKEYTKKRTKTDEDYANMSDLEWLQGAYFDEDISRPWRDYLTPEMKLYMPGDNVEATIRTAARAYKLGKDVEKFVQVPAEAIPFDIGGDYDIRNLWADKKGNSNLTYRHVCQMVVSRARVTRTRPRFDRWQLSFDLFYDAEKIDIENLVTILDYAGRFVGLCDSRPKYGRFVPTIVEVA